MAAFPGEPITECELSDATKLELVKNLPAIITAFFAGIAGILVVIIRKLDHIKELTNNSYSQAQAEIKGLKEAITTADAVMVRELQDENLRLKAERTTVITTTTAPNGKPPPVEPALGEAGNPIEMKVMNTKDDPANVTHVEGKDARKAPAGEE